MRIRFVTSTPLEISRGSGTFVGITTLANALRALGAEVEFIVPTLHLPIYTLQRLVFNESLRRRKLSPADVTVGFDMDGYTLARSVGVSGMHIAAIKGVIADEMRFESGVTRATMRIQAACERAHVRRADAVITTSTYSAGRIETLYGVPQTPHIVPELIDLNAWKALFEATPGPPVGGKFTVLSVCRFYPRKRLHVLLRAAARLRDRIPQLEVRIVGGGPEAARLKRICREEALESMVTWRENISQTELIQEYRRCDIFCLPSVQEGFGIVFLESMASGKPVVAAKAAAIPEVVEHGLLVEPENDEALAGAIERLYRDRGLCAALAAASIESVKQFDAPMVGNTFLRKLEELIELSKQRRVE